MTRKDSGFFNVKCGAFDDSKLFNQEIYEDVFFIASESQRKMLEEHWNSPLALAGAISKIVSSVNARTELSDGRIMRTPQELKEYVTPLYGELLSKHRTQRE